MTPYHLLIPLIISLLIIFIFIGRIKRYKDYKYKKYFIYFILLFFTLFFIILILALFDNIASQMVMSGFILEKDTFSNSPETPEHLQGLQNLIQNAKEDPILWHGFLLATIISVPLLILGLLYEKFIKKKKRRRKYYV